jgi:hypothetical protein
MLTVKAVWATSGDLAAFDAKAISKTIKRLVRRGLIEVGWLQHGTHYFVLSRRAARHLQSVNQCGLLSESAKLAAYGRLLFVTQYRAEFSFGQSNATARKLGFSTNGYANCFAINKSNQSLAFVRIDKSIASRPARSAQTMRSDILRLVKRTEIAELMKQKRFEYVWCTATQARAGATLREFRKYDRVGNSPVTQLVMPELVPLLCSIPAIEEVIHRNIILPRQ